MISQAAEGRADGIEAAEDKVGAAERYNEALEKKREFVGEIADMGVGRLPYGSEAAGKVAEMVQEKVFDGYEKNPEEVARQVLDERDKFIAEVKRKESDVMGGAAASVGRDAGLSGVPLSQVENRVWNLVSGEVDRNAPHRGGN